MQSDECTKVLNHLNIHVALVGSSFDDKGMFAYLLKSITVLSVAHCSLIILKGSEKL